MKKLTVLMTVLSGMMAMSCGEKNPETPVSSNLPEATLTESIFTHGGYCMVEEVQGKYNGVSISAPPLNIPGDLRIDKKSDTEVGWFSYFNWWDISFGIFIPKLPVSGEPYNVRFDHKALDARLQHNGTEYPAVVVVAGWIESQGEILRDGRYYPDYACEVHLDCMWGEGETFSATITSIDFNNGCDIDFGGSSLFTYVNESDHEVTISRNHRYTPFCETLQPGDRFEFEVNGGISYCPPPWEAIDAMTVSFDDGDYEITYERGNPIPADVYNKYCDLTTGWAYVRRQLNFYQPIKDGWTHTFTDADYEAAVAYGSRE